MAEMKNYAITEFDNELVKKSILYIGNIGLKFEKAMDLCVDHINEVMDHNQDFTVNYAIIVARDLLRKYKNKPKTKDLIKKINVDLLNYITEAESKSSFLYILGEFCSDISNSTSLIESFVEGFTLETFVAVRLQILTATIKNYVNKPD
jgi:vesicle coat complex subunit